MRRALLAVALGGIVLTGTGCRSDADPTSATTPSAAPSSIPSPSAAPDYTANTKAVCGKLEKIFNDDLAGFGTQLGKMIAYQEAGQTAEATKARNAAASELKGVAGKVKTETAAAQDPELRTAGAASAAKFLERANDPALLNKIKTPKDVDRYLQAQMTTWLTPVAGLCG
jgi:hypothetical protein